MKPKSKLQSYLRLIDWKYIFISIVVIVICSIGFAIFTQASILKHALYSLGLCILGFGIMLTDGYFDYIKKK